MNSEKVEREIKVAPFSKKIKRDQHFSIHCTLIERKAIEHRARTANCSLSEYLRRLALKKKVDKKTLPREVLQFTATLYHLAASINQLAKKRSGEEDLNAIERAELNHMSQEIKKLAQQIKKHLA